MTNLVIVGGLRFTPNQFGWTASLSPEYPTFFGHRLTVTIETTPIATSETSLPKPSPQQIELVEFLLPRLNDVMFTCSVAFRKGCKDFGIIAEIAPPYIWIPAEEDDYGEDTWSLVIERASDLEDGYHIEFSGLEVVDMFAYDDVGLN